MKRRPTKQFFIIPLAATLVFGALNLVGVYQTAERRAYDLFLHARPGVEQHPSILLLDIDDVAIARVGVFPWSRDIVADGLVLMREFGAGHAVFDIEYVDQSPLGVEAGLLTEEIPRSFESRFAQLDGYITGFFEALSTGAIPLREAGDYISQLSELTRESRDALLGQIEDLVRDNDTYLGSAARLFGSTYMTVNMLPAEDEPLGPELREYTMREIPMEQVSGRGTWPREAAAIRPAILPVIRGAEGAGFPNVVIDDDGVRRRIELIVKYDGRYFAQLGFAALLDWMGNPAVEILPNALVLREARFPDGEVRDVRIPVDEDGRLILNWPKEPFLESYRHLTFWELVQHDRLEENLVHNLEIMEQEGWLSYYRGDTDLLAPYRYARRIREEVMAGGDPALMDEYGEVREFFFTEVGRFLDSEPDREMVGQIDAALSSQDLDGATRDQYRAVRESIPQVFESTRDVHRTLMTSRERLRESLSGAFAIIGLIGTSTTDIGVTPFEKEYMNVGTHATVVNTILTEEFLDDTPRWYALAAALVLAVGVTLAIRNLDPLVSIVVGVAFVVVIVAADLGLFLLTGVYVNVLTPALTVFFAFVGVTVLKFMRVEKDRSRIRNIFSHYVHPDVVNELVSDPEREPVLGGEEKHLTALFTDVQGFSTISEQLTPNDLVRLINRYLTALSDEIMLERGTIDKYEGDAIISFFGAPAEVSDHARRACLAAVRIKRVEGPLNEKLIAEHITPSRLWTRIGINTGPMTVGNMGAMQKMDYTIMGNSVNLASRLEGVNKQYDTWVIISEDTRQEAGDEFCVRRLDRVRVVGINKPVRLYELIEEKEMTDPETLEAMETFEDGLELFEQKEWDRARQRFRDVLRIRPYDGPADKFMVRCEKSIETPPPASWDGVYNLTQK